MEAVLWFLRAMAMSTHLADSTFFLSFFFFFFSLLRVYFADSNSCRGVFNDPEHGPVLYYHYLNATVGFEEEQKLFGWNTIDFSSGWPVV